MSSLSLQLGAYFFTSFSSLQAVLGDTVSLTPSNPTSNIASISLVPDDQYHYITESNAFHCDADETDKFCVYLTVSNLANCYGSQTVEITLHNNKVSGNVDLFSLFSSTNDVGQAQYFSFLSDWDSQVAVPNGGGVYGGLFITPPTGSTSLSTTDSINTLLDTSDATSAWSSRRVIGADGWELVESERVTRETQEIKYTLRNDPVLNKLSASFQPVKDTWLSEASVDYDTSFGYNDYLIAFGIDDASVEFTQFDVNVGCNGDTRPPTNMPTQSPTACSYTHTCTAWGDPHITSFDKTKYHFQGEGYFDYFKNCPNDIITYKYPFTISAYHSQCRTSATCVEEVLVTLDDGKIISFPGLSGPVLKQNPNGLVGVDATGTFDFVDSAGNKVTYTASNYNFEIEFFYEGEKAMVKFYYYYRSFRIWTTDCLSGDYNICGLCGNINGDTTDDFMKCDDLTELDNTGSKYGFSGSAWENTHTFGESCCRKDLDEAYLGDNYVSDCGDNPSPPTGPDTECMNGASSICQSIYNTYCQECSDIPPVIDEDGMTEKDMWIEDCEYDVCADSTCANGIQNEAWDVTKAVEEGCLDTQINECFMKKFGDVVARIVS